MIEDDSSSTGPPRTPASLTELACRVLGSSWPFEEVVQKAPVPLPDDIQQKIAKYAFPSSETKLRMYASLSNQSPVVFNEAEHLLRKHKLQKVYQIGRMIRTVCLCGSCIT